MTRSTHEAAHESPARHDAVTDGWRHQVSDGVNWWIRRDLRVGVVRTNVSYSIHYRADGRNAHPHRLFTSLATAKEFAAAAAPAELVAS